ncbi:hypothetical protein B296_00022621 [Ensete ventricosum]|uniref:Uncharacterized protein n=1 Tax=Ensete ventricosum TaxID=4639 RepID=A0A426XEN6_ENSVE|nr:hypothetical protein B296_00022621 [Ensete ventricosum]
MLSRSNARKERDDERGGMFSSFSPHSLAGTLKPQTGEDDSLPPPCMGSTHDVHGLDLLWVSAIQSPPWTIRRKAMAKFAYTFRKTRGSLCPCSCGSGIEVLCARLLEFLSPWRGRCCSVVLSSFLLEISLLSTPKCSWIRIR